MAAVLLRGPHSTAGPHCKSCPVNRESQVTNSRKDGSGKARHDAPCTRSFPESQEATRADVQVLWSLQALSRVPRGAQALL